MSICFQAQTQLDEIVVFYFRAHYYYKVLYHLCNDRVRDTHTVTHTPTRTYRIAQLISAWKIASEKNSKITFLYRQRHF